jgi:hypothetical protein
MKKIAAAFDGLKFSESTRDYAIHIAKLTNAYLVGVFLDDFTYMSRKVYELLVNKEAPENAWEKLRQIDQSSRDNAVVNFEKACQKAGLNYNIHRDKNIALQDLLHESIYTDLLVIDRKETLTKYEEALPTRFINDLLSEVQCPVLLVAQRYRTINKIILLYDGGPSSVYAIKMFSYMLPVLKHLPTEVVSAKGLKRDLHVPDNKMMKEFMKRHFPNAIYKVLKGSAESEIIHHLKEQNENVLVVLGAYRRGMVSRWFRASMADALMKELKVPLFIAHNK